MDNYILDEYIDDFYDFVMEACEAERVIQKYEQRANWLADEELDLE